MFGAPQGGGEPPAGGFGGFGGGSGFGGSFGGGASFGFGGTSFGDDGMSEKIASLDTADSFTANLKELDHETLKSLSRALANSTTVKTVTIVDCPLDVEGAGILARPGLAQNTSIESLDLRRAQIGDKGLMAIVGAVIENGGSSLKKLHLGENCLTHVGVEELCRAIRRDGGNALSRITTLSLTDLCVPSGSGFQTQTAQLLAQMPNEERDRSLRQAMAVISAMLATNPLLKELILFQNLKRSTSPETRSTTIQALTSSFAHNTNLRKLNITSEPCLTDDELKCFCDAVNGKAIFVECDATEIDHNSACMSYTDRAGDGITPALQLRLLCSRALVTRMQEDFGDDDRKTWRAQEDLADRLCAAGASRAAWRLYHKKYTHDVAKGEHEMFLELTAGKLITALSSLRNSDRATDWDDEAEAVWNDFTTKYPQLAPQ